MKYPNLCTMHRSQCGVLGPRTALRYKRNGLYHDVTWSDYRWMADRAAAGLIELGVRHGDRVAILSENRYEWMVADQAILSTGAADVPLHAPWHRDKSNTRSGTANRAASSSAIRNKRTKFSKSSPLSPTWNSWSRFARSQRLARPRSAC